MKSMETGVSIVGSLLVFCLIILLLRRKKKKTDFHHKNVSNVNIGCIFNFSYSCEEGNNYFCKL